MGGHHIEVAKFLMHRVELKEKPLQKYPPLHQQVPNAPCGVESLAIVLVIFTTFLFLMHRVELKATPSPQD